MTLTVSECYWTKKQRGVVGGTEEGESNPSDVNVIHSKAECIQSPVPPAACGELILQVKIRILHGSGLMQEESEWYLSSCSIRTYLYCLKSEINSVSQQWSVSTWVEVSRLPQLLACHYLDSAPGKSGLGQHHRGSHARRSWTFLACT